MTDKKAAQNDPAAQEAVSKIAEALERYWPYSGA